MNTRPIRYLPTRLSASALIKTLGQLGLAVPLAIKASASQSREDLAYSVRASKFQVDEKALDAAIAGTELSISERLRLKFALESCGLLYN
jgi:hypothetical protein